MNVRPFQIHVPQEQLEDLKRRLHATRLPADLDAAGWEDGASLAFIGRLLEHWQNAFDWRAQEARLNRLPQYLATIEGLDIRFIHQPGKGPAPLPLVAIFPRELPMPPRSWVERVFNVQRWTVMPRGGHFAAMEQPAPLVEDIRAFFRPLRHAVRPA